MEKSLDNIAGIWNFYNALYSGRHNTLSFRSFISAKYGDDRDNWIWAELEKLK